MIRLLRRYRTFRKAPTPAYNSFRFNLASAQSHPLAEWLSFSEEAEAAGLAWDPAPAVVDLEAEGSALVGALPCPGPHGEESARGEIDDFVPSGPCAYCGADV